MNYLLDTNTCIAVINGKPTTVRVRLQKAIAVAGEIYVSSIVAFELWYGVSKSTRPEFNARRVEAFFAGPVNILPFENEDAKVAGRIRAVLETAGKPIGAYDTLLAAQALQRQLTLVTADVSEFSRVEGLRWQDWAKA